MNTLEILFFVLLFIVFYTYVGYGILLWILVKIKQSFISFYDTDEPEQETCRNGNNTDLPEITLFVGIKVGRTSLSKVMPYMLMYYVAIIGGLLLVTFIPAVSTALPQAMGLM